MGATLQPSLESLRSLIDTGATVAGSPNTFPVYASVLAEKLTPHDAYLKLARPGSKDAKQSFLLESAVGAEIVSRYSFIGFNPRKVIATGPQFGREVDPLIELQEELSKYRQPPKQASMLPPLSGGAVGYISYDCIKYFEPRTKRDLKDTLQLPEAVLMLFDTIVAFDNVYQRIQVIHNIHIPDETPRDKFDLDAAYAEAQDIVDKLVATLQSSETYDVPQGKVRVNEEYKSNIGQEGYESHVNKLKQYIKSGDIFQAVPSQRVAHPTDLHPFNVFRHLRTVNPSPYMFYIDLLDFQIIGASPELLVKNHRGRVITHPIAGTVKRGKTADEDDALAAELLSSAKDRAEHVMLVDLARNDVNRVCEPSSCRVDRLMSVERFSHVIHLVSEVSGVLREGKTRFDAFRSIFPAGTVSGAPKVRAMELISELEGEKRGVYAGAVGHWGYSEESMDTCIALRTMVAKDGVIYLQAGGGIVYDSDPTDEYIETVNKMGANSATLREAETIWARRTSQA